MGKLLRKEDLNRFLYKLKQRGELIAPVKENSTSFQTIKDIKKIYLDEIPNFSAKKYFLPSKEEILSYEMQKSFQRAKLKERIIFGMRLCDLNAVLRMDSLFLDPKNEDCLYKDKRKNTIMIGYNCKEPGPYCFCDSMALENYHDLFFYDMGEFYYIDVGSERGMKLVSRLKDYDYKPPQIKCEKILNKKLFLKHFKNPIWEKLAKNCLSCGRCNLLCPTCYCFTVDDKSDITLTKGIRTREWDSCQFKDFTKVAGGFVFRDKRTDRLKHRIYHKLLYYRQRFNKDMCVGCGKCIEHCPTKIDFVEAINKIK